ncbi:MAG TPA: hypothetical protein PKV38_10145, partial [bacterium]|nr:hypothetical protein [bacterium]
TKKYLCLEMSFSVEEIPHGLGATHGSRSQSARSNLLTWIATKQQKNDWWIQEENWMANIHIHNTQTYDQNIY